MGKRGNFTDAFKAKIALEALRGDKTVQEIAAAHHQLHPNQVSTWKKQAQESLKGVFAKGLKSNGVSEAEVKYLRQNREVVTIENDFCRASSANEPRPEEGHDQAKRQENQRGNTSIISLLKGCGGP